MWRGRHLLLAWLAIMHVCCQTQTKDHEQQYYDWVHRAHMDQDTWDRTTLERDLVVDHDLSFDLQEVMGVYNSQRNIYIDKNTHLRELSIGEGHDDTFIFLGSSGNADIPTVLSLGKLTCSEFLSFSDTFS